MSRRPAAFLDRDGTIMEDVAYARDPNAVVLLPGAADAIRRLNDRNIPVMVVTNQSGIARGTVSVAEYNAVERRIAELLGVEGATIDATYMCPHHPDFGAPCDCRKPGLGLYRQAIADHDLDGVRSLFAGDRWRDVAPAAAFGGTAVLVLSNATPDTDRDRVAAAGIRVASSLAEAVDLYLAMLPADDSR